MVSLALFALFIYIFLSRIKKKIQAQALEFNLSSEVTGLSEVWEVLLSDFSSGIFTGIKMYVPLQSVCIEYFFQNIKLILFVHHPFSRMNKW